MNLVVEEKRIRGPAGLEGGWKQPAAGTRSRPASPDLQFPQCTQRSQASRSLQMLLLPFAWDALLLLICPAKACIFCSLKGCLLCEVSPGFPGWTQAALLLCFHLPPGVVTAACLPIRLRAFVGGSGDTGYILRATQEGVWLLPYPGQSEEGAGFSALVHLPCQTWGSVGPNPAPSARVDNIRTVAQCFPRKATTPGN